MPKRDPVRAAVLADRGVAREVHVREVVGLCKLRTEWWNAGTPPEVMRSLNRAISERNGMWAAIERAWREADRRKRGK